MDLLRTRMAIFTLMASLIGLGPVKVVAGEGDIQASGGTFVDLLAKRDFAVAFAQLDPTMQGALPADKLEQIWEGVQQTSGQFQKRIRSRVEQVGAHLVVLVTCQFSGTLLDVKVVFNAQGRIAGLFFAPSQPPPGPPVYANTNSFREVAVKIGSG